MSCPLDIYPPADGVACFTVPLAQVTLTCIEAFFAHLNSM